MMRRVDFEAVNYAALPALPSLLRRWLPDGRLVGREYVAKNPRRFDKHPGSFKINLSSGKWCDFATGDAGGDVVSLAAYLSGASQLEAAINLSEMLGVEYGYSADRRENHRFLLPPRQVVTSGTARTGKRHHQARSMDMAPERDDTKRTEAALRIWQASAPAPSTLVDTYLQSRGLQLQLPQTLRFHAGLKHPSGGIWPALVALVTRGSDDTPLAIHRTFLARDGSGKAPIYPQKMMLGPCRGGAVRLGVPGDVLMVGEGIETCLAAMLATGSPAWAALSTSGLRALNLLGDVREVIVLADGDDPGEAAARDCALRWQHEGRHVRIARPPQGSDFNDMLLGRVPRIEEGSA